MCVGGCEKARVVDRRCDRIDRSIVFRAIIEQAMLLHDAMDAPIVRCDLYSVHFPFPKRSAIAPWEWTRGDSS